MRFSSTNTNSMTLVGGGQWAVVGAFQIIGGGGGWRIHLRREVCACGMVSLLFRSRLSVVCV